MAVEDAALANAHSRHRQQPMQAVPRRAGPAQHEPVTGERTRGLRHVGGGAVAGGALPGGGGTLARAGAVLGAAGGAVDLRCGRTCAERQRERASSEECGRRAPQVHPFPSARPTGLADGLATFPPLRASARFAPTNGSPVPRHSRRFGSAALYRTMPSEGAERSTCGDRVPAAYLAVALRITEPPARGVTEAPARGITEPPARGITERRRCIAEAPARGITEPPARGV